VVRVILTDIEGTLGPVAFVREVLFPYAAATLPRFIRRHANDPEVGQLIAEAASLGGVPASDLEQVIRCLIGWIAADAKVTPLKALQGLIWEGGYREGHFRAEIYPDALARLQAWHGAGVPVYVYSSGSIRAQDLYFAHTIDGDLRPLLSGLFDTTWGPKTDPESYRRIAAAIGVPPAEIRFLSDLVGELDAAATAGMRTCWLVRPADTTADAWQMQTARHPVAASLLEVP
jgi:enolase-phosphatase E1